MASAPAQRPPRLWIVRSLATVWEMEGRLRGRSEMPPASGQALWPLGLDRATPIEIHYPGDESALTSARQISKGLSARLRRCDSLADPDLGLLEGLSHAAFTARYPQRRRQWDLEPLSFEPPDGESFAHARWRILVAAADAIAHAEVPEIALVLHPFATGVIATALTGAEPHRIWEAAASQPPVSAVHLAPGAADRWRELAGSDPALRVD